jgi:hypothetical protein
MTVSKAHRQRNPILTVAVSGIPLRRPCVAKPERYITNGVVIMTWMGGDAHHDEQIVLFRALTPYLLQVHVNPLPRVR